MLGRSTSGAVLQPKWVRRNFKVNRSRGNLPLRGSLPRGEIAESGARDLLLSDSEREMQFSQRQVSTRKQNHPNGTIRAII